MMIKIVTLLLFSSGVMTPSFAQGICAPGTLSVTLVSGKVIQNLDKGDRPIPNASVVLRYQFHEWIPVAETNAGDDGSFSFSNIVPGKYFLTISAPDFKRLDIPLLVKYSSRSAQSEKDIIVTLGFNFTEVCGGGHAEVRNTGGNL